MSELSEKNLPASVNTTLDAVAELLEPALERTRSAGAMMLVFLVISTEASRVIVSRESDMSRTDELDTDFREALSELLGIWLSNKEVAETATSKVDKRRATTMRRRTVGLLRELVAKFVQVK